MPALPRPLPRICVALGLPTASELNRAAEREYKDGSTFFEFRLDHLSSPSSGIEIIRSFRRKYPDARILATCRLKQAKGRFAGTIEQQMAILQDAGNAGAAAIDVEVESAEHAKSALLSLRESAPLFVSYHNFENTPALEPVFRRLLRTPADAYKIVTTARKPSDALRVIQFVRQHRDARLIALAMSDSGTATRILAPSLGCLYTYAAPLENCGTAPGQISANLMRSVYHCEKLTPRTRIYGIIADPVAHSKSPLLHNRAFHARRLDAVYLPFRVEASQLGDWMTVATSLPVMGFSVTLPHKQRMLRYLDVVEPLARLVGAVNTVWRKNGKWRGTNTDVDGVLKPLGRRVRLAHARVLIAGYGGAARAAAIAVSDAGASVTITGRNLKSGQALARIINADVSTLAQAQKQQYDALIHATPVGMFPKPNECLFNGRIPAAVVLEMVYNPQETLLLKRAREQGCTVIPGSEMLLEQAASQFEIWTGESAPREVMRRAFEQHA